MIAITFALPAESSEFLKRLSNKSESDRNGVSTVRGNIGDPEMIGAPESLRSREVEVMHTGVGEKLCRERLRKFLEDQTFDLLISSGFAGALTDELRVGDLLLAKNISTIELNKSRSSFSELRIRTAYLITLPHLVDSTEERNRIARRSGAAAVDMETEFIARLCAEHGIPLLSLRIITDTSRQPFPAPSKILFDIEQQRVPLLMLAKFFLLRPNRVPSLVHFARTIARARKTLASALATVVREL
jgi:adenosylhomocysteine nucleosidase